MPNQKIKETTTMEGKHEGPLLKLCGLWKREGGEGGSFYSGKLNTGVKILVMKNKYKTEDSHPDLVVFLAKAEAKPRTDAPAETGEDKEIPF